MPDTPISKAQGLLARVLKDSNNCRLLAIQVVTRVRSSQVVATCVTKDQEPVRIQKLCIYTQIVSALQSHLRDHAFKLRPLALSSDLIDQLKACAMKLGHQADALQNLISKGKNKNKNYADLIAEVMGFQKVFEFQDVFVWSWHFKNLFDVSVL